jgi:hypothetical protein
MDSRAGGVNAQSSREFLKYKWHTRYYWQIMGILTVRLTDEEERLLLKRSRSAGMKKATYVRQLIRETPFLTSTDVLDDLERRYGDERLRIERK